MSYKRVIEERQRRARKEVGNRAGSVPPRAAVQTLGRAGLSVFRNIENEMIWFDAAAKLSQLLKDFSTLRLRGYGTEKPPSVTLVDYYGIRKQTSIHHVPQQVAADAIYQGVPSLRHKVTVGLGEFGLFSNGRGQDRPFGFTFDDASRELITAERNAALVAINKVAGCDYSWASGHGALISLGRVSHDEAPRLESVLRDHAADILPPNLELAKAVTNLAKGYRT